MTFTLMDGYTVTLNDATEYLGHVIEIETDYIMLHIATTNDHQYIAIADILTAVPATPDWLNPVP